MAETRSKVRVDTDSRPLTVGTTFRGEFWLFAVLALAVRELVVFLGVLPLGTNAGASGTRLPFLGLTVDFSGGFPKDSLSSFYAQSGFLAIDF